MSPRLTALERVRRDLAEALDRLDEREATVARLSAENRRLAERCTFLYETARTFHAELGRERLIDRPENPNMANTPIMVNRP